MSSGRATEGHGSPEVTTGRISSRTIEYPARERRARTRARRSLLLLGLLGALAVLGLLGAGAANAAPARQAPAAAAPLTARTAAQVTALTTALPAALLAQPRQAPTGPTAPTAPTGPTAPANGTGSVTVNVGGKPSQSITILMLVTVLAVAPSLLLLVTSFTKIFVVLSLTRNALGLQSVPPNQVIAGLSLFLSLFIMGPVMEKVYKLGISPYLNGTLGRDDAWKAGVAPLRQFMLSHTRPQEVGLILRAGGLPNPSDQAHLALTTIIPAFVLSELRSAMIIGFVIYIPFVIIDLVVASSLMSLGMMMLPPVTVSLPFKLLLFVMVDGWGLVITALVQSYHTG